MNLAIVHYHLGPGGVTRVIENHLRALAEVLPAGEVLRAALLHAEPGDGWPQELAGRLQSVQITEHVIPRLGYDERTSADPAGLASELRARLTDLGFTPDETVIHTHNHALGKNASLPGALAALGAAGFRLLLQIHDFAEDFRPDNYRHLCEALGTHDPGPLLYPQGPTIHYATLNRRDREILAAAGTDSQRLHVLPNPASVLTDLPDRSTAREKVERLLGVRRSQRYFVYPVRGIRRKNVGEMLLWSALGRDRATVGITLPPKNPLERPAYDRWKRLAQEWDLDCHFETGLHPELTFAENVAAADALLTTSVTEGFGLVFLESWAHARPLVGRDLPEITADFREAGLRFDGMYSRLDVPIEWIGATTYARAFAARLSDVFASYGRSLDVEPLIEERAGRSLVDFGELDETFQEQVIRQVVDDDTARQKLLELNPMVAAALSETGSPGESLVEPNRRIIEREFSLRATGERLQRLYTMMLGTAHYDGPTDPVRGEVILERFLHPERFRMIRAGSPTQETVLRRN